MVDRSSSRLHDSLLSILECPVCTEIMKSPILQCLGGHSFCSNCIKQVTQCPVCKTSVRKHVRNIGLEKLSEQVTNPCPNQKHGCQERVYGVEDPHEIRCPFREGQCLIMQNMDTIFSWKRPHTYILEQLQRLFLGVYTLIAPKRRTSDSEMVRNVNPSVAPDDSLHQTRQDAGRRRTGTMVDIALSDLQDVLLSVLLCPVCTEIMKTPILQCSSGHSFCFNCIEEVTHCPICSTHLKAPVRNYSLEKMSEQLTNPCPNNKHGCQERVYGEVDPHENRCLFKEYVCPISQDMDTECSWRGPLKQILKHAREVHPQATFNIQKRTSKFTYAFEEEYAHHVYLMHLQDHLFVSYNHYEKWQDKYWKAVQYLGPSESACKFVYKITLSSENKYSKITYSRKVHTEDQDIQTLFSTDDCFTITEQQIQMFKVPFENYKFKTEWNILCI